MNETTNNKYSANDIEVLEGLDAVRKRPAMYIGSTSSTGLHHIVWEIVHNGIDEALSGFGNKIGVTIHKDGSISVSDQGRGIPCDINKKYGVSAVELVFTKLHSGGKFGNKIYATSGGMHGVGASVTNALSTYLNVVINRDGKIRTIKFHNGGKVEEQLTVIGTTRKTGTIVRFKPDPAIFDTVDFKYDTIASYLKECAYLLKSVMFVIKDERTGMEDEFCYSKGLAEYVEALVKNKRTIGTVAQFEGVSGVIQMDVAFQFCSDLYTENVYSYANNIKTKDGGTHESGMKSGIVKAVNEYIVDNNLNKGGKLKIDPSDIKEGLVGVVSIRGPESKIQFEGQTKGKLNTPEINSIVSNFVYSQFSYFLTERKTFADELVLKCISAQRARVAAREAKDNQRKVRVKTPEMIVSDKLTPCQSKEYALNELFIVEGESAGGTARKGRDRMHQAVLPLRGKPLNTNDKPISVVVKNAEFATIIATLGTGFGINFNINDIKYGKVIIMTDADTDGAHIQTLLLTFFYHHMRELITQGLVYVAIPPLYRVYKDSKYCYAWNDQDLEEAKEKIGNGYKISRYKGLGEMNSEQLWETTMNKKTRTLIQITIEDLLLTDDKVNLFMNNDASLRKEWVKTSIDFSRNDKFIKEIK